MILKNYLRGVTLTSIILMAALVVATSAWAQRGAGAKARGNFGGGFWSGQNASPSYSYQPTYPQYPQTTPPPGYAARPAPSQPLSGSASFEPVGIQTGDLVRVAAPARLKIGHNVLTTVPAGETFRVIQVRGRWVGIGVQQNGAEVRGWVNFQAVEPVAPTPPQS